MDYPWPASESHRGTGQPGAGATLSQVSSVQCEGVKPTDWSRWYAEPQAQAALAAVHTGTLVEAGVERVTDGIHTEPGLAKGKTYRLNLVCGGSGSAQLQFAPAKAGTGAAVPCDGSAADRCGRAGSHRNRLPQIGRAHV